MTNWAKLLSNSEKVIQMNRQLAKALAHCPLLAEGGWNFRCVECHIDTGTYPPGYSRPWHMHEEFQIESALTGVFEFEAEGSKPVILRPGQALVIPWRLPHRWKCLKPGVMVGISLELIPTLAVTQRDDSIFRKLTWLTDRPIRSKIFDLANAAILGNQPPFQATTTACHLFLFLAEIMRRVIPSDTVTLTKAEVQISEIRGGELVGRVMRRLNDDPSQSITLDQVARDAGLSSRQIHRLFMKHTGKSLNKWLIEQRLEMSRKLLAQGGRTLRIKEIAFQCGFSSHGYFCNLFRKVYGFAPTAQITGDHAGMKSAATFKYLTPTEAQSGSEKNPAIDAVPRRARR